MTYQEKLLLTDNNIVNLYRFQGIEIAKENGVIPTEENMSYVAVVNNLSDKYTNEKHDGFNPAVKYLSVDQFQQALDKSKKETFNCIFCQPSNVLKDQIWFTFIDIDGFLLYCYIIKLSNNLWGDKFKTHELVKTENKNIITNIFSSLTVVEKAISMVEYPYNVCFSQYGNILTEMLELSNNHVKLLEYIKVVLAPLRFESIQRLKNLTKPTTKQQKKHEQIKNILEKHDVYNTQLFHDLKIAYHEHEH